MFYLEGLLRALMTTEHGASFKVMQGIIIFLWRFTFAGVPEFLRSLLLDSLHTAASGQRADSAKRGEDVCAIACLSIAVAWTLQGDEQFVTWVTQQPQHAIFQSQWWQEAASSTGGATARCVQQPSVEAMYLREVCNHRPSPRTHHVCMCRSSFQAAQITERDYVRAG